MLAARGRTRCSVCSLWELTCWYHHTRVPTKLHCKRYLHSKPSYCTLTNQWMYYEHPRERAKKPISRRLLTDSLKCYPHTLLTKCGGRHTFTQQKWTRAKIKSAPHLNQQTLFIIRLHTRYAVNVSMLNGSSVLEARICFNADECALCSWKSLLK